MTQASMTKSFVDLDNSRFDDQRQVMEKIIADGCCPFCPDFLAKYHKQPILKQGQFWTLTNNQWPYAYTRVHLLAIFTSHIERFSEMPAGAGDELFELFSWAEKEYHVKGGGMAVRFGDTNYSAGTVTHLHAQFVVPDWDKPDFEPVRIKIGKTKRKAE